MNELLREWLRRVEREERELVVDWAGEVRITDANGNTRTERAYTESERREVVRRGYQQPR